MDDPLGKELNTQHHTGRIYMRLTLIKGYFFPHDIYESPRIQLKTGPASMASSLKDGATPYILLGSGSYVDNVRLCHIMDMVRFAAYQECVRFVGVTQYYLNFGAGEHLHVARTFCIAMLYTFKPLCPDWEFEENFDLSIIESTGIPELDEYQPTLRMQAEYISHKIVNRFVDRWCANGDTTRTRPKREREG